MLMLIMKNMTHNTMYTGKNRIMTRISFPSIFSLHSSTNLSINLFIDLQFL